MQWGVGGTNLGMEQGGQEEWVLGQLDNGYPGVIGVAGDHQPGAFQDRLPAWRKSVATNVVADEWRLATDGRCARAVDGPDETMLAEQRADQRGDHRRFGAGIDLRVGGLGHADDVPGVLHEYVLKAASGSEQGYPALARIADRCQRAVETAVGAGGCNPETVYLGKPRRGVGGEFFSGYPAGLNAMWQPSRGQIQGGVRRLRRVVVADDGNARWSSH